MTPVGHESAHAVTVWGGLIISLKNRIQYIETMPKIRKPIALTTWTTCVFADNMLECRCGPRTGHSASQLVGVWCDGGLSTQNGVSDASHCRPTWVERP